MGYTLTLSLIFIAFHIITLLLFLIVAEVSEEQQNIPSHWDSIYCNLHSLMEQLKLHNLKMQQHQQTALWSEKDMANLIKALGLTFACLKDCCNMSQQVVSMDGVKYNICASFHVLPHFYSATAQ
uniref:Uncharacterized protein n=1 Tax=Anopheles epiroticus TaxID=199890 RepID=A0A182P8C1_9DIPT